MALSSGPGTTCTQAVQGGQDQPHTTAQCILLSAGHLAVVLIGNSALAGGHSQAHWEILRETRGKGKGGFVGGKKRTQHGPGVLHTSRDLNWLRSPGGPALRQGAGPTHSTK